MNAVIKAEYRYEDFIKTMKPENLLELKEMVPALQYPPEDGSAWKFTSWNTPEVGVTHEQLAYLVEKEVPIKMVRFRGQVKQSPAQALSTGNISIALPGLGLFMVDTVDVFEDHCTHELQQQLIEGWRIIAVIPALDARRPTYILGRQNHNRDN